MSRYVHPDELRAAGGLGDRVAHRANLYAGSMRFLRDFAITTAAWCVAGQVMGFDRWPYPLFTWAVSVLAIVLTCLVLIAGNRQAALDRAHQAHAFEQIEELMVLQRKQMRMLDGLGDLDGRGM